MARLEHIRLYPVKGLNGIEVESAEVLDGGTLEHDREFALFETDDVAGDGDVDALTSDGDVDADAGDIEGSPHANGVFNAKHSNRFHRLDTDFDIETTTLTVETADGKRRRFVLDTEHDAASEWFSDYFDEDLTLRQNTSLGFVDRRSMGPSVVSTATLETVASWFEGLSVESARRRLRANVEISGVPAFWEDRFVGDDAPAFTVNGVRFEGVTPCGRCVVPQRDPDTGDPLPEFRERFVRHREGTFPDWADADAFDHLYSLMLIAEVLEEARGQTLSVGDAVEIVD